jgi:predicted PurR-regulated permease PerM
MKSKTNTAPPPKSAPAAVSGGWSLSTRYFVLVLLIILFFYLAWWLSPLVGPLIIAALLAYVLNPLVNRLRASSHLSKRQAVHLVYILFLLVLVALPLTLFPVIMNQARGLAVDFGRIADEAAIFLLEIEAFLGFEVSLLELLVWFQTTIADLFNIERIAQLFQRVTTNLIWMLVILVTPYYLLQEWDSLRDWLLNLGPPAYQADARRLYEEIKQVWHNYLRGQLLLMLAVGALSALLGAAVGLPGALLLGLVAGVLDVVPSLGPAVAMVLAVLVAWFEGSTYLPLSNSWFALLVLAVYLLIQTVENVWLRPRIMGRTLQMHPALIFLAVVGALVLLGPLMALIAVPLLGSIAVLGRYIRRRLMGKNPWPAAPTVAALWCSLLLLGLATGCRSQTIDGSGQLQAETRPVSLIHSVNLGWTGEMVISQGESEALTIIADDNLLPLISSEARHGELVITIVRPYRNEMVRPSQPARYELMVRDVNNITVSGAAIARAGELLVPHLTIHAGGQAEVYLPALTATELIVRLTGSGRVEAAGQVERQQIMVGGAGGYDGGGLQSRAAQATVSGSGEAILWATDSLEATAGGRGVISYYGRPQLNPTISGSGEVRALGERP